MERELTVQEQDALSLIHIPNAVLIGIQKYFSRSSLEPKYYRDVFLELSIILKDYIKNIVKYSILMANERLRGSSLSRVVRMHLYLILLIF